jgi:hypothetical protein
LAGTANRKVARFQFYHCRLTFLANNGMIIQYRSKSMRAIVMNGTGGREMLEYPELIEHRLQEAWADFLLAILQRRKTIAPRAWLADTLARIAETPQSLLSELLPWNWMADRLPRAAA